MKSHAIHCKVKVGYIDKLRISEFDLLDKGDFVDQLFNCLMPVTHICKELLQLDEVLHGQ